MDVKTTELIAIGAAVTANCPTCVDHHMGKSREAGVDEANIREAVRVGRMVRKGSASTLDKKATSFPSEDDR